MTVLITGGAGFIGSNFIKHILAKTNISVINLDKLTYAGELSYLKDVESHPNYIFVKGDICDTDLLQEMFAKYNITAVIHFAAESHVDNSINAPRNFIKTNIEGTFTLLEAAKKHWLLSPHKPKPGYETARFHHISTDEVYGSLGPTGAFTEETPYAPNSPYSASKAASDFLVRSYHHTYGLNAVTTNCSNNYGPHQHDEKLIPTIIRKALNNQPIPIYGTGQNIRDWLYVEDHCEGIMLAFEKGVSGETYNIGGNNELSNFQVAEIICKHLNKLVPRVNMRYEDLITFVADRPGHDFRYAINASKITNTLGWKAKETFETGIGKTISWYLKKYSK